MGESKVYLVGGAVRDLVMGLEPKDFDFVVVGSSPTEMTKLGFTQVGADFPVFLHPVTGDEYALARTERKTSTYVCPHEDSDFPDSSNLDNSTFSTLRGSLDYYVRGSDGAAFKISVGDTTEGENGLTYHYSFHEEVHPKTVRGYNGFDCEWEGVTLLEDLERRDLTMNAMAKLMGTLDVDKEGNPFVGFKEGSELFSLPSDIIDPFGGQDYIKLKGISGIGEHFREDPLRVLRIARFLARYGEDWWVEESLWDECVWMAKQGMLDELTPERVWKELSRALLEPHPELFFEFMDHLSEATEYHYCFLPELSALNGVKQNEKYHPEGDAFVHTLLCLKAGAKAGVDLKTMFAILCHDFGKRPAYDENTARGETHLGGHEKLGVPLVEAVCDRWKVPNDCRELAIDVTRDHLNVHNLHRLKPSTVCKMFERWGALKQGNEYKHLWMLNACTADARGRGPDHENVIHRSGYLLTAYIVAYREKVDINELFKDRNGNLHIPEDGAKIGEAIRRERIRRIAKIKREVVNETEN